MSFKNWTFSQEHMFLYAQDFFVKKMACYVYLRIGA